MELSITGDGYIKCVANMAEHIETEQITQINASNLSLPCMKDRYEEKVLFYHIGDNISITEYLRTNILSFDQLKELTMNLAELFLGIKESGLSCEKVIADMKYVFISPHTKQLKVIQCPIIEYGETGVYQRIMSSICRMVHSKNAYVIIGYIMEEINNPGFELGRFEQALGKLENSAEKAETVVPKVTSEPIIQKQIVEKQIIRNKTSYLLSAILSVCMVVAAGIIFPYLFQELGIGEGIYRNLYSVFLAGIITIAVFLICKLVSSQDTIESVRNLEPATQQSVTQTTPKAFANDNLIDKQIQNANVKSQQVNPNPYNNTVVNKPEAVAKREPSNAGNTVILDEEVEINPLKRQEMYKRNSVPTAYLIEEATQKKYEIRKNNFIIGRSVVCDLNINNSIVSKEHARIIYQSGDYYLIDLKSKNFTYLNKAQIEPEELYKIENGARIGFGNQWYIFQT